jgi:hypothetical protein
MLKYILACILLLPGTALAGNTVSGKIRWLGVNLLNLPNGAAIGTGVAFESSCRQGDNSFVNYMVIDFDRPGMKEAYALAMAAYMGGKEVYLVGTNDCYSNYELLKSISFK